MSILVRMSVVVVISSMIAGKKTSYLLIGRIQLMWKDLHKHICAEPASCTKCKKEISNEMKQRRNLCVAQHVCWHKLNRINRSHLLISWKQLERLFQTNRVC